MAIKLMHKNQQIYNDNQGKSHEYYSKKCKNSTKKRDKQIENILDFKNNQMNRKLILKNSK